MSASLVKLVGKEFSGFDLQCLDRRQWMTHMPFILHHLASDHLMFCLFPCLYYSSWKIIDILSVIIFFSSTRGLYSIILDWPLISIIHYAPCASYIFLFPIPTVSADVTISCQFPLQIKHLKFWNDCLWRPSFSL